MLFFNITDWHSTSFFNSGGSMFFFLIFTCMVLSGLTKIYIFIKYNISTYLTLAITLNVKYIRFRLIITVSNKYSILSRRVQFWSFIIGNMYKYIESEYLHVVDFMILSGKHFFRSFVSKRDLGDSFLNIQYSSSCFIP